MGGSHTHGHPTCKIPENLMLDERMSMSVGSSTASIFCGRKILTLNQTGVLTLISR